MSEGARKVLNAFREESRATPSDFDALEVLIGSSPRLIESVNRSVREGALVGFEVQHDGVNAGGQYFGDTRTISLPVESLRPMSWGDVAHTIYVLGHELQHAHSAVEVDAVWDEFGAQVNDITDHGGNDYVDALNELISDSRADEDRAELEGWNTFVEYATVSGKSLREAVRDSDCAQFVAEVDGDRVVFHEGFVPDLDGSLPITEQNRAAMMRYFSGGEPEIIDLGRQGGSDYANYYAAHALSHIGERHRARHVEVHGRDGVEEPPIHIDFATQGLRADLLERNGIDLGPGAAPLRYLDVSTRPPTLGNIPALAYPGEPGYGGGTPGARGIVGRQHAARDPASERAPGARAESHAPAREPAVARALRYAAAQRAGPRSGAPSGRSRTPRADPRRDGGVGH